MPRLLSRALLVLGGATAATAAAWLLSSGTASAAEMPSVPQVPGITAPVTSTSDMGVSTTVSSVADAVTEPSQHAVLPLPAVPAVPAAAPAGLGQLTTGLRDTVGRLGDKLPVDKDLPTQLVQHLGRTPVSTPAVPTVAVPVLPTPRHLPMQPAPFAGQHGKTGGVADQTGGAHSDANGAPRAPHNPGNSPFGPLTVPAMPGGNGSGNSGFAGPAGVGLASGIAEHLFPELHVVDVLAPAIEPARVMPGKQPGVTPD